MTIGQDIIIVKQNNVYDAHVTSYFTIAVAMMRGGKKTKTDKQVYNSCWSAIKKWGKPDKANLTTDDIEMILSANKNQVHAWMADCVILFDVDNKTMSCWDH